MRNRRLGYAESGDLIKKMGVRKIGQEAGGVTFLKTVTTVTPRKKTRFYRVILIG